MPGGMTHVFDATNPYDSNDQHLGGLPGVDGIPTNSNHHSNNGWKNITTIACFPKGWKIIEIGEKTFFQMVLEAQGNG